MLHSSLTVLISTSWRFFCKALLQVGLTGSRTRLPLGSSLFRTQNIQATQRRERKITMKSPVRLNPASPLLFMTLVYFTFSALVPKGFAVVPPPDGGYPNFTTQKAKRP